MYISRSLQASAYLLSFSTLTAALALHRKKDGHSIEEQRVEPLLNAPGGTAESANEKRQDQELECINDRWQDMLDNNPVDRVKTFCNEWLGIAPATTVIEWTPTMSVCLLHLHSPRLMIL